MLTIFLSTIGIENCTVEELEDLLINQGKIYIKGKEYESLSVVPKLTDGNGNEFFSINIVVELKDEPARIEGGEIISFGKLNEINGLRES